MVQYAQDKYEIYVFEEGVIVRVLGPGRRRIEKREENVVKKICRFKSVKLSKSLRTQWNEIPLESTNYMTKEKHSWM